MAVTRTLRNALASGRLAQAFNHMSDQVSRTNRAMRDLLANVSHELRTPLTSIQGFSQALVDGLPGDPQEAGAVINDEADRIRLLVDDLLYLSEIESGALRLDVRLTIETDDGALIYMTYGGVVMLSKEVGEALARGEALGPDGFPYFVTKMFTFDLWIAPAYMKEICMPPPPRMRFARSFCEISPSLGMMTVGSSPFASSGLASPVQFATPSFISAVTSWKRRSPRFR